MTFPIVLAIFGALLFLLGLVGQVEGQQFKIGTNSRPIRWISIVIGIISIGLASIFFKLEVSARQIPQQDSQSKQEVTTASTAPAMTNVNPDKLIETIKEQQRNYVKQSCGVESYQCFTDEDLNEFVKTKAPAQITDKLKTDNRFIELVLAIKGMAPSERQKLLDSGRKPLRPTWAQLGRISCEGQTDAGQKAEIMIAFAIVDSVKELVKLPVESIKKLYI